MRYMKIGTLISAGVLMLSSMILNSGCSEAGNGRKQTTENPGAIFGEVKSAAGAKIYDVSGRQTVAGKQWQRGC